MQKLLTVWLIAQLILIWMVGSYIQYRVDSNLCVSQTEPNKLTYFMVWLAVPLVFFTEANDDLFCK